MFETFNKICHDFSGSIWIETFASRSKHRISICGWSSFVGFFVDISDEHACQFPYTFELLGMFSVQALGPEIFLRNKKTSWKTYAVFCNQDQNVNYARKSFHCNKGSPTTFFFTFQENSQENFLIYLTLKFRVVPMLSLTNICEDDKRTKVLYSDLMLKQNDKFLLCVSYVVEDLTNKLTIVLQVLWNSENATYSNACLLVFNAERSGFEKTTGAFMSLWKNKILQLTLTSDLKVQLIEGDNVKNEIELKLKNNIVVVWEKLNFVELHKDDCDVLSFSNFCSTFGIASNISEIKRKFEEETKQTWKSEKFHSNGAEHSVSKIRRNTIKTLENKRNIKSDAVSSVVEDVLLLFSCELKSSFVKTVVEECKRVCCSFPRSITMNRAERCRRFFSFSGTLLSNSLPCFELAKSGKNMSKCFQLIEKHLLPPISGGTVLEPVPGLHKDVTVYDFQSQYPNIIVANNIGLETVTLCHTALFEKRKEQYSQFFVAVPYSLSSFCVLILKNTIKQSAFAMIEAELMKMRSLEKEEWKKLLFKRYANCLYGWIAMLGSEIALCNAVANTITFFGRTYIQLLNEACVKNQIDVVYGDTDSIFVKGWHAEQKSLQDIAAECSIPLSSKLFEENVFDIFCITRKKRYCGLKRLQHATQTGTSQTKRMCHAVASLSTANKAKVDSCNCFICSVSIDDVIVKGFRRSNSDADIMFQAFVKETLRHGILAPTEVAQKLLISHISFQNNSITSESLTDISEQRIPVLSDFNVEHLYLLRHDQKRVAHPEAVLFAGIKQHFVLDLFKVFNADLQNWKLELFSSAHKLRKQIFSLESECPQLNIVTSKSSICKDLILRLNANSNYDGFAMFWNYFLSVKRLLIPKIEDRIKQKRQSFQTMLVTDDKGNSFFNPPPTLEYGVDVELRLSGNPLRDAIAVLLLIDPEIQFSASALCNIQRILTVPVKKLAVISKFCSFFVENKRVIECEADLQCILSKNKSKFTKM